MSRAPQESRLMLTWQGSREPWSARVVRPMPQVEYLSYACSAMHAMYAHLTSQGHTYPVGTLQAWLRTVYDEALE